MVKVSRAIIVILLIAGLLSVAQHHHDDFDGHEDCPICALVQDGLDYHDYTPQIAVFWAGLFTLAGAECTRKANPHFHFYRPRGPPAIFA